MRLLIIGSGIAALSAAESFRKNDEDAQILMISDDTCPTYYRIKLPHYLGRLDFTENELLVKDASWFSDKRIDIMLATHVTGVDFTNKTVHSADGNDFEYDKLLLANGSHPFVPHIKGSQKKGVFTLHSLDDLKSIQDFLKDKERVVIIGGGLAGLEVAHGLIQSDKDVSVLEFFPHLLPRQLDAELSKTVKDQLENEGMTFYLGNTCEEILGDETVTGVILNSGQQIKADAVIFASGVRPNIDLFNESSLSVAKGVLVNDRMQTNIPDVYAAGDIAEYNGSVFGLWSVSSEQGKIAGTNLAGKDASYATSPLSVTTLSIGQVKMFSVGDISEPESVITYRDDKAFHRLFIKSGHMEGAVLTGDLSLMLKAKNLVIQKKDVKSVQDDENAFTLLMMQ